jgi:RNA polymerase sigma factor for flagellar operon FliA
MKSEMKELLTEAIAELPEKERQVLALYYYEELTMKEIGQVLGVGESRVSQIHSAAVVRLRASMRPAMQSKTSGKKAQSVSI